MGHTNHCRCNPGCIEGEGAMSHKEFLKFKKAIAKIDRECNTPEKAREILVRIGYLNADGQLTEKYR
jgi:hypothetical protein